MRTAARRWTPGLTLILRIGLACLPFLLFQSAFWIPGVPRSVRIGLAGFFTLACLAPQAAMLVVAGLAPLTGVAAMRADFGLPRLGEAIVLAFLAGWLVRNLRPTPPAPAPTTGLTQIATLFVLTVLASLTVSLGTIHATWMAAQPFGTSLVAFLGAGYLGPPGIFRVVPAGLLFIEGIALYGAVVSLCTGHPDRWRGLLRMSVAGGVAAAALSILRVWTATVRSPDPWLVLDRVLSGSVRLSAHVADVNAAGSYFVMVGLVALGATTEPGRWRVCWLLAASVVALALLLSGSRAAIWAGLIVLVAGSWVLVRKRSDAQIQRPAVLWGAGLAVGLTLLAIVLFPDLRFGLRAQRALEIRYAFTVTSLRMLETRPTFGVGLDSYYRRSAEFMPESLKAIYVRENAHNYFLQVAAELGLVGGLLFALVTMTPLAHAVNELRTRPTVDAAQAGIVGGVAAFFVSCLSGHPLLHAAITYPLWMTVGLMVSGTAEQTTDGSPHGASGAAGREPSPWRRRLAWTAALAILLSIAPRIRMETAESPLERVYRGFSAWEQNREGRRYRRIATRASFYVPASARAMRLSFRAGESADRAQTPVISIALDGQPANRLELDSTRWIEVRMILPRGGGALHRRIDLTVDRNQTAPGASSRVPDVLMGEVMTEP